MKKNKFKKIIAFLFTAAFVIIMLLLTFSSEKTKAFFSEFSFSTEFSESQPLSLHYFNTLNDTEKAAYVCIYENIRNHPEYIKIPEITKNEFNNVFFAVKNDNPDILCFSDSCTMVSYMFSSFVRMEYNTEKSICDNMTKALDSAADAIIADIGNLSDYEKEKYIHEYIIENCDYTDSEYESSAYGCLIDGKAVCSGYSRAAMLLLKKAGVESFLVSGTGFSPENEQINHMWNIVYIDNEPYHLDVTWDDPVSDSLNNSSHLYFNLTTQQISVDHFDIKTQVVCEATQYNYFEKEGLLFDSYDRGVLSVICEELSENIRNGNCYIEFAFTDADSYNEAVESIIDNVSPSSDMYRIIDYISETSSEIIDVSHMNISKEDSRFYIRLMFDLLE